MLPHFKHVAIVGVGLIGGSLGMILRSRRLADVVVGIGRRIENLRTAVELGAIDRYVENPRAGIDGADLVVLATPVDTYERHLREWAGVLKPGSVVSDVGSVKGALVEQAERLVPAGVAFVGAHPIAGKEKTGVAAGSTQLFQGARCILTPTSRTDASALQSIRDLWETAGSMVLLMDPYLHDKILGAVSHLPHVAAFALMNALADLRDESVPELDLGGHSGGGLRDTTRIAASSPEMWRDILVWNHENVVEMIEMYERHLDRFKSLIKARDRIGIEQALEKAKREREQVTKCAPVSA